MKNLFNKQNSKYHYYCQDLEAKGTEEKILVLVNYLLPGIVLVFLINVKSIHDFFVDTFKFSSIDYQFWLLIGLTFGWHMAYPIYMLKVKKGYTWKATFEALSLDRFSIKGSFFITPLFFLLVLIFAVPYMGILFPQIHDFLQSVNLLAIPEHSIFHDYDTIYQFAPWQLGILLFGNIVGEEIYFRGYLMKKSSFFKKHNWWIHSILFTVYHFWQMPMTYALGFISLSFGLFMVYRKNTYELMTLHILVNLVLPLAVQVIWY